MDMDTPKAPPPAEAEESYDDWFRRKVQEALDIADSPDAVWIPHEEVVRRAEIRREKILARIEKSASR
ncbi:hypothetical protein [Rhizobium sp. TRM95796]|uniref:hypothetical protein n=1 Tax=Rhizobium sp. TRM95796 TaxID=2979862 RepID=UPI0021E7E16E|nr:hypothetical protein [Rhizobium sp. TRM95796]MCV3768573.1 hypothetical protein [Rhizobium sp. TRM95796]